MIPQCSWRCDGMRARAPADAASEKARDQGGGQNAAQVVHKGAAPGTPRPRHQHGADPGAQKQKYAQNCNFFAIADCRGASKRGLKPEKAANRTHSGPFPPRRGRKGVRNRKKVAQKSKFLFLRDGSSQRSISRERLARLQCQSGRAAVRNPEDQPCKHSYPRPRQRSRASSTEKCNI